jgi:predicted DNA-binding transcriptional regulator YafY
VTRIAFVYNHRHRLVDDPEVRFTKDHNIIITGTDADHGKVRTFRVDRIDGRIKHLVPVQRQSDASRPR